MNITKEAIEYIQSEMNGIENLVVLIYDAKIDG